MNMQRKLGLAVVLAVVAAFGGCGSDDDPPPVGSSVPGSASTNSAGLTSYLQALTGSTDADLLEPADISGFTAPTTASTELEEPAAI